MLDLGSIKRELKDDLRPRKMIRYALVPHFGGIMNPVKDVFALLVRTIALLFVQSKLLPQDHPVMRGDVRGMGAIWLMIVDASANLKFNKQNIPQIAVFYAIVGMLVFCVMATLTFLLKIGVQGAHAQTYTADGLFTVSNSADKAQTWIGQLFPYNGNGALNGIATALGTLLGYYNAAILVLATFIALYTIIVMILESAHDGEVGGKRHHEVYAILRLVMGIGLLVPVSQGYNSAQIITIQLAKAGSALASNLWEKFDSQLVTAALPTSFAPGADINTFLAVVHAIAACQAVSTAQGNSPNLNPQAVADASPATKYTITYDYKTTNDGLCGSVTLPAVNTDLISGADPKAWVTSYTSYYSSITNMQDVTTAVALSNPGPAQNAALQNIGTITIDWNSSINNFQNLMNTQAQSIVSTYTTSGSLQNLLTTINNDGWVDAGVTFIKISKMASDIYSSENVNFAANAPDSSLQGGARFESSGTFLSSAYNTIAQMGCNDADAGGFGNYNECSKESNKTREGIKKASEIVKRSQGGAGFDQVNSDGTKVATSADANSSLLGTFSKAKLPGAAGALAIQIQVSATNTAPSFGQSLVNIVSMGQYLIGVAGALFVGAVAAGINAAGFSIGSGIVAVATLFGSVIYPLAIIFSVVIPLLPATRFIFGIITWLLTLFEALVALPVVVMFSIQGEGAGLWAHGRQGYLLVLQMMLRPVLMVFGLVGAVLIFDTIYSFISYSIFATWYNSTVSTSTSTFTTAAAYLSWIGFLFTYGFLLYSVANICFGLINTIPDRVLSWIGSQTFSHVGDHDQAAQNALTSTLNSGQQLTSGSLNKAVSDDNARKSDNVRQQERLERQQERLEDKRERQADREDRDKQHDEIYHK